MMIEQPFSTLEIVLLAGLLLVSAWEIYFILRYMLAFWRLKRRERQGRTHYADTLRPVSVIICADNEADMLRQNLPKILEQDYPDFEVVVVDNGSMDDTQDVLNLYRQRYDHLHTTFVPQNARMRSTRKLAITLGIKAAHHDHLLFTTASGCPESRLWIRNMMRNFVDGVEFVIGYNAFFDTRGGLNRLVNYDNIVGAMKFMGAAYCGKPQGFCRFARYSLGRGLAVCQSLCYSNQHTC